MVEKYHYRDWVFGIKAFDVQLSKMKIVSDSNLNIKLKNSNETTFLDIEWSVQVGFYQRGQRQRPSVVVVLQSLQRNLPIFVNCRASQRESWSRQIDSKCSQWKSVRQGTSGVSYASWKMQFLSLSYLLDNSI